MELCIEYACTYYTGTCAHSLLDAFLSLAETCLDCPASPLAELPLLSASAAESVIAQSFGPRVAFDGTPVTADILRHCKETPDVVAASDVVSDGTRRELSYHQLGVASLAVMSRLRASGIEVGERVGVYLHRGIEMSVAVLGILRAGCIYVPLDPDMPPDRLRKIASVVSAVLTASDAEELEKVGAQKILRIDVAVGVDDIEPVDLAQPEGDAYLIHTSGTTGVPNGVVITHRALRNRLDWMGRTYPIGPSDVILQKTPISFDVSVWELIWPLMWGAHIHYAHPDGHKDAHYLEEVIVSEGITILHFVPSMLGHFLQHALVGGPGKVRHLFCSGEALPGKLVERWRERFGGEVHNLYGPTEAAIDVTAYNYVSEESDPMLPIGFPIQNTGILILDRAFMPMPAGAVGDLFIAGENLARCYFGDAELTTRKFIRQEVGGGQKMRLYASGDRARRRADNAILFEGRRDNQIKLNGVRIELEDIEAGLRTHPDIIDVAVVLQSDGEPFLTAFYRSHKVGLDSVSLRDWMLRRVPQSYMPAAFKRVDQFPTTVSGKLDRNAFATVARVSTEPVRVFTPPVTQIEIAIVRIWEDVLGLSAVGIDDNFYALGGDSLRSLRCTARMKAIGLVVEMVEFLKHPTVRELARIVRLSFETGRVEVRSPAAARRYPAPSLVQALWVSNEINADYRSYVTSYRIRGRLDREAFQKALDLVVRRHPILRSALRTDSSEKAFIEVEAEARVLVEFEDLRIGNLETEIKGLMLWLDDVSRYRWRWDTAPLLRCVAHQLSEQTYQVTLIEPWLDGWSVQTLALELFDAYVALLEGGSLKDNHLETVDFAEFVAAEDAALNSSAHLDFWRTKLAQSSETRISPESRDGRLIRIDVALGPSAAKLRTLASHLGLPLKSLLMGVHCVVVSLLVGMDRLTTGVMFNGRLERAGGENTLGCHLNALPVTVDVSGASWADLAYQCLEKEIEITPWRRFPLDSLKRQFNWDAFDTLFNYTDFTVLRQAPTTPSFMLLDRIGFDQTYMALTAQFGHDLTHRTVTLYLEAIEPMTRRFGTAGLAMLYASAFEACCDAPEANTNRWIRKTVTTCIQLIRRTKSLPSRSLIALFNDQAKAVPDRCALRGSGKGAVTFGELHRRAAEIAAGLQNSGVVRADVIGVCMERSSDLIAAILAVLAVGGIYLPLPPDAPPARLRFMVDDSEVRGIIVDACSPRWAFEREFWPVTSLVAQGAGNTILPDNCTGPEDYAHILYSSGSTGRPKGVLTSHRVVLNRLNWMWDAFPFQVGESIAQKTTLTFVDSIWELFGGLLAGVETHLFADSVARDPVAFTSEIRRGRCTRLTLTPSFAEALLRDCPDLATAFDDIRVLVLSGEPLKTRLAVRLATLCPNAHIVNLYGSTETGGDASSYIFNPTEAYGVITPLGAPIANCSVEIRTTDGAQAYPGVVGEIVISGACVCSGYIGWARNYDAQVTERHQESTWRTGDLGYLDHKNCLHYIGRADRQMKVRGVRIHPAEIEEALWDYPDIGERTCLIDSRGVLVLFYQSSPEVSTSTVRGRLAERLPASHLPSRVVQVEQIPKTLSGKVDRYALLSIDSTPEPREATDTEETIIEFMLALLGEVPITPLSDFFAMGGDSLAAATLARRLGARFGFVLPVRAVFEAPVIADLAAHIQSQRWQLDA